jgi:hypothetical protein
MSNKAISVLHEEYKKLVGNGKYKEAKEYLANNILDFPKEIQGKIRLFLFEEGLKEMLQSDSQILTEFQVQGLKIMKELEIINKELEDKLKTLKIKKSLQK